MALSEMQKLIIEGLKICGLKFEQIMAVAVRLQTQEKQMKMLDYLETAVNRPSYPSFEEIFQTAEKIEHYTA